MVVAVLLIIRAMYTGFKFRRYISKNHPKLYAYYCMSYGQWYPGNLISRRLMRLMKEDDIGDPELIRFIKKGLVEQVLLLSWLCIAPFIIMLIYIVFF